MVGHLAVVLAQLDATALDEHIDILGVVHHRDGQLVFFLESLIANGARGDKHRGLAVQDQFGILATQFESLVLEALLQQRTSTADGLVAVHKPVFLPGSVEDSFHRLGDARREVRHTSSEIGHTPYRIERLHISQVAVAALSVDGLLVFDAHLAAHYRQVDVDRTVGHAAVAHQAVFGNRLGVFLQFEVTHRLQHIDTLHIDYAQLAVHRTAVDTDAAARAGTELEHRVARLLVAVAHT